MGKQFVKARRRNWDADYYLDLMTGEGFQITEPAGFSLNGSKQKSLYGARSPLFGTNYEDEQAYMERYRCECGRFKSQMFEGEICPFCKTKVEFRDTNIKMTGWINFGTHILINPYFYRVLCQAIGTKVFEEIIKSRYKVNRDGNIEDITEDDIGESFLSPFSLIGIRGFFERYEEILAYFKKKNKKKAKTIDLLLTKKRFVFTSHIPIYSTMLRQQSITSDTFYFKGIDKLINTLFSLSEILKNGVEDIELNYILERSQEKVNKMWDMNFDLIDQKEGFIRGRVLGGPVNYIARNVIIPDPTLYDNEIDLSYHTFLVLFSYKIMYYLMKIEKIPLSRAYERWEQAYIFDETIYEIMLLIIQVEKPRVIINRNPTLNYYSILLMKIRTVKKDSNDFTMSVPLSILNGLNADFDGDILNIIAVIDKAFLYMFRKFDPITRMIISRDNSLINEYFTISKGEKITLYNFLTIGKTECDTPEEYNDKNDENDDIKSASSMIQIDI